MINDSFHLRERIIWYTSLIGKKKSVQPIRDYLAYAPSLSPLFIVDFCNLISCISFAFYVFFVFLSFHPPKKKKFMIFCDGRERGIANYRFSSLRQGRTARWLVAWSFTNAGLTVCLNAFVNRDTFAFFCIILWICFKKKLCFPLVKRVRFYVANFDFLDILIV